MDSEAKKSMMMVATLTKSSSKQSEEASKFLGKPHIRYRPKGSPAKQNRKTIFLGSSELCHLWRTSTFTPDSCVDFDCLVGGTVLEVHKMFLNEYKDYHSLLNVVVSCGLNNIPRYSDQQTIVQLKCLAESIHSLNKENKVIFATVPYAPKFCHSMRYASMKMISKTHNINEWIKVFNEKETKLSLDLSGLGLKNNPKTDGTIIYNFEDWKEDETMKKLHFSSKVKTKVAVTFTKLCNTLDKIFKVQDEEKATKLDLVSQTQSLIEKSSVSKTPEVNFVIPAIPYHILYPSRVEQNEVTDICVKCKWISCRCEDTDHEFSFCMTSEIFLNEIQLPPHVNILEDKTHLVKSEMDYTENVVRTTSKEVLVEDSSLEELKMVENDINSSHSTENSVLKKDQKDNEAKKSLEMTKAHMTESSSKESFEEASMCLGEKNMIDNVESLEKKSKELKTQDSGNIIYYIMQNAKQHCSKCFIDHTPLPRWCTKYKKNEKKQRNRTTIADI